ncbi:thiamine pyrophosphate-binding protein [Paenibacillus sp. LMG 31460]|uniref:Thiamine pyrophosphate-binding protein n=1 Tax=Paenibacillus germinis TaxID=2654979 RepID=A0ABX1Z4Y9_9BACL|nr:thiamine pyrophosphate-binding protein [Paenibacillus germinis]NOU88227.1 thiamine pyrophosphate-binding protein [Paenibacillus germinis]
MPTKLSTSPSTLTVAEAILEQLRLWNVKRIYGVVGDAVFGLMNALAMQDTISFIAVKHESVAAMMASAEAKLNGQLGVCIAQMGPGLANLINGMGDAFLDNAPVLAITGQAPLNKIGTSYKQYINQQELVQAISRYSQMVVHPDAVIESLTQAMQTSILQRSVSHLSIPTDVFSMTTAIQPREQPQVSSPFSGPEIIQQALHLIQSAKQPMMLVGSGAISDREGIQKLAESWCCGVAMSYGAMGILPDSNPLMLNSLGEGGNPFLKELFQKADVVLAVETSWWPDGFVPSKVRIVQISKHPSDFGISIPVDIGLVGDIASLVPQLLEGLKPYKPQPYWVTQVQQCKHSWMEQNEVERNQSGSPLPPSTIIRIMEQNIAADAVVTLDEGDSTLWFLRNFRANRQHILLSNQWRTMGFGLPAAMAAKLCWPEKQVVCMTGDGGLEMVLADLLTATRYGIPITVIVFNNGTLQMERDKMYMKGFQPEGTQLTNPDFAKLAGACGWKAYRIETAEQLEEALKHSPTSSIPVLLDVFTAKIQHPDFISS